MGKDRSEKRNSQSERSEKNSRKEVVSRTNKKQIQRIKTELKDYCRRMRRKGKG